MLAQIAKDRTPISGGAAAEIAGDGLFDAMKVGNLTL